jgi:hypothetical protein
MISQYFTRRILPLSLSTLPFRLGGALICTPYHGKCRTKFPDKVTRATASASMWSAIFGWGESPH